jgi:DNA-binding GntR family transcriptional regulator
MTATVSGAVYDFASKVLTIVVQSACWGFLPSSGVVSAAGSRAAAVDISAVMVVDNRQIGPCHRPSIVDYQLSIIDRAEPQDMELSDKDAPLAPPQRKTLGETIAESLREAILCGRFQPGERLVESSLAKQMGVSQTTVREGLARLERIGLVERHDKNRAVVASLTANDMKEIDSLRSVLCTMAALIVVREPKLELIARLKANVQQMQDAREPEEFAKLDLDFHEMIVRASGHSRLISSWDALRSQSFFNLLQMTRDPSLAVRAAKGHREWIHVLETGDLDEAMRLSSATLGQIC